MVCQCPRLPARQYPKSGPSACRDTTGDPEARRTRNGCNELDEATPAVYIRSPRTSSAISGRYGLTVEDIRRRNDLKGNTIWSARSSR